MAEAKGHLTLLALLQYEQRQFGGDHGSLAKATEQAQRRRRIDVRRELVPTQRTEQVEETVPVTETYHEDVVTDAGGWFRKKQVRTETKTRTVLKKRAVARRIVVHEERVQRVVVDGLGDPVEGFDQLATVLVPAGRFTMGEGSGAHGVVLSRSFELGTAPVTQALYEAVMGTNPARFHGPNRPVEQVSWLEAVAFCNALSKAEGLREAYAIAGDSVTWDRASLGYRLPTEAEWEYACRAGTTGERYGDVDRIAWYDKNSDKQTHPVGEKQPNAWGLYDMLGNVWEWCWDWYGDYPKEAVTVPVGAASGSNRVARGGSWYDSAGDARAADRDSWAPDTRGDAGLGFRLARSAP